MCRTCRFVAQTYTCHVVCCIHHSVIQIRYFSNAIPPLVPHPPAIPPLALPNPRQTPVCDLCPCVLIVQHPLMSEDLWCLVFCSCVSLLRMMVSSFIHVPEKDTNLSFFMAAQYSMMSMCHIFFIQSIVDIHLGWFQVFAIVNSDTVNIHVHMSL